MNAPLPQSFPPLSMTDLCYELRRNNPNTSSFFFNDSLTPKTSPFSQPSALPIFITRAEMVIPGGVKPWSRRAPVGRLASLALQGVLIALCMGHYENALRH